MEYKPPGELSWSSDYFSEMYYSNECWNTELVFPSDAPTGLYSSRARALDLDNDWSPYFYLNNSLWVNNSAPKVLSFEQSPRMLFRTETITITASGTDLETRENLLL